jgi:hypothetical protein
MILYDFRLKHPEVNLPIYGLLRVTITKLLTEVRPLNNYLGIVWTEI